MNRATSAGLAGRQRGSREPSITVTANRSSCGPILFCSDQERLTVSQLRQYGRFGPLCARHEPSGREYPSVTDQRSHPPITDAGKSGPLPAGLPQPSLPRLSGADTLWLLVALLLSLALRIPFFNIPMIHDEGGYAYAARSWFEGTGQLYDDIWISRPQGIFVLYGIVFRVFGENVWSFRFAAWIFAALTVLAVWLFARRWSTPGVATVAALLTAILSSLPNLEGFTANAEVFMGLPAAFAAFWLLRQQQTRWTRAGLIGIGILIGIATVLKPSGVVMLFVALAFIGMTAGGTRRERLRLCGIMLLGVTIVGIVTLLHGWYLGWGDFFYATITYRLTSQSSATVSTMHHLRAIGSLAVETTPMLMLIALALIFKHRFHIHRITGSALGRTCAVQTTGRVSSYITAQPDHAAGTLIRLWALGALAGIAMGGDWWTHYIIQVVPPLALWLAWNMSVIIRTLRHWRRWLFTAMTVGLLLLPFMVVFRGEQEILNGPYEHPGYPAQAEVARYIQENSEPGDTIYVAFDQASIYYLSDRQPAYRHLYDQELRALPNSYADIISIISGPNRPLYIVSTVHPGPFPDDSRAFWREVGKYYDVETTIDGVPVYRAKPGLPTN